MLKIAQVIPLWNKIYQKLKTPPPGVNLGSFPAQLPPLNKIVIDPSRLADNTQAIGYVSTEDADQNGVLDTIHIASPRLEEAIRQAGISPTDIQNFDQLSGDDLKRVLMPFVELISHEMGHLKDFNPDSDNPFPGGEAAAETAARSALQSIATNTSDFVRGNRMKQKIIYLAKLATRLDQEGHTEIADQIDVILAKLAQMKPGDVDYGQVFNQGETGTEADPSHFDIREDLQKMRGPGPEAPLQQVKQKIKGKIRPVGDPYTYNFDPVSQAFTVMTTPPGKEHVIGRKIGPGDGGYDQLIKEVSQEREPELQARTELAYPPGLEKLQELGFKPGDTVAPASIDPFIFARKSEFHKAMSNLADKIMSVSDGFGGPIQRMLEDEVMKLKNPSLTGAQAIELYNSSIQRLLLQAVGPKNTSDIRYEFQETVGLWKAVYDLQVLRKNLMAQQMIDSNKTLSNLAEDAETEKKELEKAAVDNQLFWGFGKNPFNRSNERFTR